MSDDIKARLREVPFVGFIFQGQAGHEDPSVCHEAADHIEALEAENARLKTAIATHGAEACGILRSYHQEDGNRLWLALRAALAQDNPTRDQGAGDQADDA